MDVKSVSMADIYFIVFYNLCQSQDRLNTGMKSILGVILILSCSGAWAQQVWQERLKQVICSDLPTIVKALKEHYNEVPVTIGRTQDRSTTSILFVNRRTGTWSFVQYDRQIACLLASGEEYIEISNPKDLL